MSWESLCERMSSVHSLAFVLQAVACVDILKDIGRRKQKAHMAHFVSQEEATLACVLAPERAVYHALTSKGGR